MRTSAKKRPVKRPNCGTTAGYSKHSREGERPCATCAKAMREYQQRYYQKKTGKTKKRKSEASKSSSPAVSSGVKKSSGDPLLRPDEAGAVPGGRDDHGRPFGLRREGRRLWDSLHESFEFDAAQEVVVTEVCRMKDRLERFTGALSSRDTFWFELGNEREVEPGEVQVNVVVNGMISEARQTQAAIAVALGKIGVLSKASGRGVGKADALDQLAARRAERLRGGDSA